MAHTTAEPANIRYFNLSVGLIFNYLYSEFPIRQTVGRPELGQSFESILESPERIEEFGPERYRVPGRSYIRGSDIPADIYVEQTLQWLEDEGYVRSQGQTIKSYQLTTKTLSLLKLTPLGLDQAYGTALGEAVKSAGSEAGRAAVGEIVGQIIGAAARGMMGG
jgi:hypothetical protein